MPLIMLMLKFTLQIFHFNLTLNQFQIQTPLQLNQLMVMKCIISYNSSIQNMINIFWMLTSRRFKLDWWSPLLQKFIESLLCWFTNMEELMLQSHIVCHIFPCFSQPSPLWNWLMETRYVSKELGLFYVAFLTIQLYIQLVWFIIVWVTLPTLYHQVP